LGGVLLIVTENIYIYNDIYQTEVWRKSPVDEFGRSIQIVARQAEGGFDERDCSVCTDWYDSTRGDYLG
jgi:hypothetical protein